MKSDEAERNLKEFCSYALQQQILKRATNLDMLGQTTRHGMNYVGNDFLIQRVTDFR